MPDPPRMDIRLGHEVGEAAHLPGAVLIERAAAEGLHELRSANWPTSVQSLEALGTPLARATSHGGESALYEEDGVVYEVELWGSHVRVVAAGRDRQAVTQV